MDILSVDTEDSQVIGRLVDLVRHHCDAELFAETAAHYRGRS